MVLRCGCLPCLQGMHPHTRNVLQLGLGFFFIFLAFNSQGFIEESVLDGYATTGEVPKHAGYTSLSIIYASFTVLNFIAPALVKWLGTRTSLVLAGCAYVLFLAGFLFVHHMFLYFSSALLGLGAAVIWTAQGKYLTLNSTEQSAGKHSSLFLALSQACLSCGGLFLLVVFLLSPSPPDADPASASFDRSTVKLLYGSFTGIAVVGVAILAFLPKSRSKHGANSVELGENEGKAAATAKHEHTEGNLEQIKSIFLVAATPKMAALALSFAYSGILLSFWSSIFPTSIINTLQLQSQFSPKVLIALNGIVKGFGQPLLSVLFRWMKLDKLRRSRLVLFGMLVHIAAFALCFANLPDQAPLSRTTDSAAVIRPSVLIALLCGFLLSFGDACWTTQMFSFLITNYPDRSAEAFALLKFYQSLLTCILFYLSGHLLLHAHLVILLCSSLVGYAGFVLAERLDERTARVKPNDEQN